MEEMKTVFEDVFIPNVTFELIPIKDLVNNQEYQRNLSIKHIERAAAHFDIYQVNPVKVSRRDGKNYVVNGQHTMEIIAKVSGSRDTPVWCMVYDGLVYQHEADIFANQQKYVKSLTTYEIFLANIEAGSDKHLLIKDLVESYMLKLGALGAPGCICGVNALEYIYDKHGYEILSRTLRILVAVWEGDQQSLCSNMLKGLAKVFATYDTRINDDMLIEKLSRVSPKVIIRNAKDRRSGPMGFAEAIVLVYNSKLRNGLSIEDLYAHTSSKLPSYSEKVQ